MSCSDSSPSISCELASWLLGNVGFEKSHSLGEVIVVIVKNSPFFFFGGKLGTESMKRVDGIMPLLFPAGEEDLMVDLRMVFLTVRVHDVLV